MRYYFFQLTPPPSLLICILRVHIPLAKIPLPNFYFHFLFIYFCDSLLRHQTRFRDKKKKKTRVTALFRISVDGEI